MSRQRRACANVQQVSTQHGEAETKASSSMYCTVTKINTLIRLTVLLIGMVSVVAQSIIVELCIPFTQVYATNTANHQATVTQEVTISQADTSGISMTIDQTTPIISDTSGYHAQVTIHNQTDTALPAGTFSVASNISYTFISRVDIQQWSQGTNRLPVPDQLTHVATPVIEPHQQAIVSVDIPADHEQLQAIKSWGAKPLLLEYKTGESGQKPVRAYTFFTRSPQGLSGVTTPPLRITLAMMLTTDTWQADQRSINTLIGVNEPAQGNAADHSHQSSQQSSPPNGSDQQSGTQEQSETASSSQSAPTTVGDTGILRIDDTAINRIHALRELHERHQTIQLIAEPSYAARFPEAIPLSAVTQPGVVNITAYAASKNKQLFEQAGVGSRLWDSQAASALLATQPSSTSLPLPTLAWQSHTPWTLPALQIARQQGYQTVIADSSFDGTNSDTVHTGRYVVPTDAGDINVLVPQHELSLLASGMPSSQSANSELSAAGRLARFVAQSAFYQMEQPYLSRNLLVTLPGNLTVNDGENLLSTLEHAPWLALSDLSTLLQADPYQMGQRAYNTARSASQNSSAHNERIQSALQALRTGYTDIRRFADAIIDTDHSAPSSRQSTADRGQIRARDTLAPRDSINSSQWIESISQAYAQLALHALNDDATLSGHMVHGAQQLSDSLLHGVRLIPARNVTIVSSTANMPVTIVNTLPYAVNITVSSATDSMEIVTSPTETARVPAYGETQITFKIRAATVGDTTAHLLLLDRRGTQFSFPQSTIITSALQISDASGFIIIAGAGLLGVVGLFRQFRRNKERDE